MANFATFVTLTFSPQKMDEFNFKIFKVLYLGGFKMDVIKW